MRLDPGSLFNIEDVLDAESRAADTYNTTAIDHGAKGRGVSFLVSCGTFATGMSIKTQYSEDNASWTNEPDATAGNLATASLATAGSTQVDVPNPRGRYSRLAITTTGVCVFSVTAVSGPKYRVDEGS